MEKKIFLAAFLILHVAGLWAVENATIEIRGRVVDKADNSPLSFCNILVDGSYASTVANSEGEFLVKLPENAMDIVLTFSHIGYKSRKIKAGDLLNGRGVVSLDVASFQLPQIDVLTQDAEAIVRGMFEKAEQNYPAKEMLLTAFYRESIKKNKSYVSLSEAVVDVRKFAYNNKRDDVARLYKSRKQADYEKLDTLVFKLMGGPYNNLLMDVMKRPDIIFSDDIFKKYIFSIDKIDWMDDKLIYVINFTHQEYTEEALYQGKLYIDAVTLALRSAVFNLSLKNQEEAVSMFIRKKPFNAKVTLTDAKYRVNYFEKDGKWYYAYSRIELGMKINWKKKLFNTNYFAIVEMAVTDRDDNIVSKDVEWKDRLRENVIIADKALGFSDPDFWGVNNIIEPEKPIEAAIRKIQKQLEKR
jgi:hypothetical protein